MQSDSVWNPSSGHAAEIGWKMLRVDAGGWHQNSWKARDNKLRDARARKAVPNWATMIVDLVIVER